MLKGYSFSELYPLALDALKKKTSVLIQGHPGCGKSSMAKMLAADLDFNPDDPSEFIDIRLAQKDPVELCGFHAPDMENRKTVWLAPEWLPVEKAGFILLDEINAAVTKLQQSAAYQIVLDRKVNTSNFHPDTVVLACGNLEEDQAITTTLSSALNNRCVHYILRPDANEFIAYGMTKGIDPRILAFIAFGREKELYDNDGHPAFASPRSWEMGSRLILGMEDHATIRNQLAATVGEGKAGAFMTHLKIYSRIDLDGIVLKGDAVNYGIKENTEPSFLYALVFGVAFRYSALSKNEQIKHAGNIYKFLSTGLSDEHQTLFWRNIVGFKDNPAMKSLQTNPGFADCAKKIIDLLTDTEPTLMAA